MRLLRYLKREYRKYKSRKAWMKSQIIKLK